MSQAFEQEQQVAIQAVRRAAALCRTVQAQITPDILEKKDKSPVTVADFGTQALVCQSINAAYPNDPIIGEEDASDLKLTENAHLLEQITKHINTFEKQATPQQACNWIDLGGASQYSPRFWTLDPIDGTKGFLRGDQYAIALALIIDGQISVAALGCPNMSATIQGQQYQGLIFAATLNQGAKMFPIDDPSHSGITINATDTQNSADACFCESVESAHTSHSDSAKIAQQLNITNEPYRIDSQCKYAAVAKGDADIYLRLPTRPGYVERIWDHAAGVLVVTEAGGKATDIFGNPLDFTHGSGLEKNKGVIVTNGQLHTQVLDAITAVDVKPA